MNQALDIIICTFNREKLLRDCLRSLQCQKTDIHLWKIIIVNNSNTQFCEATNLVLQKSTNIKTTHESQPGLSVARNAGISLSQAPWIAFLDDDAIVPDDYVSKILNIIKEREFDCFGGHIKSWWKYGQPRWLDDDFGSKPALKQSRSIIYNDFNWGSNIIINRKALEEVGNFPTYIGMKGKKLGYAAENIVQSKLRDKGFKIGYDPELYIEHVVMPQKLKLNWHLKSAYATGRDGRRVFQDQYGIKGFARSLKNCVSRPVKSLYFLITKQHFYWENAVLESLRPYFLFLGKLRSLM